MKSLRCLSVLTSVLLFSCSEAEFREQLDSLDARYEDLKARCDELNERIVTLESLVEKIAAREKITGVSEIRNDLDEVIGYVISFLNSSSLIFALPEDNGDDMTVIIPSVSVKEDQDGFWWTVGGEYIIDQDGNRVAVGSSDGRTPQLKVEEGDWLVSLDGGTTWITLEVDSDGSESFSGVVSISQDNEGVVFILADGTTFCVPMASEATLSLSYSHNVVPGATAQVTYRFTSSTGYANVSVCGNRYIGSVTVTHRPQYGDGFIDVNISEEYDVSRQKLFIYLDYGEGVLTKVLTFSEKGVFEIDAVPPIPAFGGDFEVSVTEEGYDYIYAEVTSGSSWLWGNGTTYTAAENTDYHARTGAISFQARTKYGTVLFSKTVNVVQFGTGQFPCYDEYVGNWKMTGNDLIRGEDFSRHIQIKRDPDNPYGYLITGLSPSAGVSHPVRAVYNQVTGSMEINVPQEELGGTDIGLYQASCEGGVLKASLQEKTFVFHSNSSLNTMSADLDSKSSFVFAFHDGSTLSPDKADEVFYHDVVLERKGVAEYYSDGQAILLNQASAGLVPLNLVILGDGYQRKDLRQGGKFEKRALTAMGSFFAIEPYKSFKDRFNVYMVPYESLDEGPDITSSSVIKDTYFSSVCTGGGNTLVTCDYDKVLEAIRKLGIDEDNCDLYRTVAILLVNTTEQSGSCWYIKGGRIDEDLVGDGFKSFALAMLAADTMGASGLVKHEAGGHGFGRLADEYNWGNAADEMKKANLADQQNNYGFYLNVTSQTGTSSPWYKFIGLEGYEDVGYYEGAWGCSTGLFRPEQSSIMLNNQGEYNAPSRELIYRRIILQTEGAGSYSFDRFLEYDKVNLR